MIDRKALAAFLAGALDWDRDRAQTLADAAILACDRKAPAASRHWIGEAQAAFDESLARIPDGEWGSPDYWVARATAAATIASAEQARIANVIAWKQLHATRQASAEGGVGMLPIGTDDVDVEIEAAIGIAEREAAS